MRCLLVLALILAPVAVLGRRAFPVGVDTRTEEIFRKINPYIKWDQTNYLVDLSGPYAICSNANQEGVLAVSKDVENSKLYGANGIGALISGTRTTGTTASLAKFDIYTIINSWVKREPFISQIKKASKFGCSIEPGCSNGKSIVVCLFTPKYTGNDGFQGDKNPENIKDNIRAVAYTPEEYTITEQVFTRLNSRIVWDRSHLLENLSGGVTSCAMIGKTSYDASRAQTEAKSRGVSTAFIFGWTRRNGNTDNAVRELALGWSKSDWRVIQSAKKVGCSLAVGCGGKQDILVASCFIRTN